jgi:hypothetical protein
MESITEEQVSVSKITEVLANEEGFHVELDSHADTCCVGSGVLIVNETNKRVKVTPFLESLGSVSRVPVVSAALAYDDPRNGET